MTNGQRKLVAIVAADVAGYSRLMGADEEYTIAALHAHRREVIDPKLGAYNGRIANTAGDSLLIEFTSAIDALRCAIEVQREVASRNIDVPPDRRLHFRVGINVGEVVAHGEDLLGDEVNVAARLESMAEPGGICFSAAVHDLVTGKIEGKFTELGELTLKNIDRPVRAYALASVGSGESKALHQANASVGGAVDNGQFERPSIVIMPFKDLGGGEQGSLAEGIRLGLHSMLVKLSGLFLLHTGTVENYRGQDVSANQVGREINVRNVVEGTVRTAGDRVRITIQVTDALTGQLILAEHFDRVLDDIFALEDEIALEIVGALEIELRSGETGRAWWRGITDPAARIYVHQGLSHLYKATDDDNVAARRVLEKLDALQPDMSQCLGLLALTHWRDAQFGWSADPADSMEKAAALAERAVALGDPDGIATAVIGYTRLYQRRHQEALNSCSEALARRPSCPMANGLLAEVMQFCGEPGQAIAQIRNAIRHVRASPPWMINILAASFRDNDDIDAAISTAKEAVRLFPDELYGRVVLCGALALVTAEGAAAELAQEIVRIDPSFTISRYAETLPYEDKATLDRITEGLDRAGLPM
jgi:class 3 adenylate cyclase/TolB-like protein